MSRRLYIRNFDRYQHYKNRRPPWVKLYRDILDDEALMSMRPEYRWVAVGMIILATESESRAVEGTEKELSRRLAVSETVVRSATKALLKTRFLASSPLAGRKQNATPEKETEKEKNTNHRNGTFTRDEASYGVETESVR